MTNYQLQLPLKWAVGIVICYCAGKSFGLRFRVGDIFN